jgi:amino acid transporter
MVGAGIFALLGAAGTVAGAAVWLSFLIAGVIAALQGYSFAKLGARYPSAGGLLEYVAKGFGNGHFFKLDSIASIGSAVALLIFTLITAAHLRIRGETGANTVVLVVAIAAAAAVLLTFVFTTLIHEPASIVTLLAILALSVALDLGWKRRHASQAEHVAIGH